VEEEKTYMAVEDLDVYRKLCQLHLEVCDLTYQWPGEERYELGSQVRRSSNSSLHNWLRRTMIGMYGIRSRALIEVEVR
jgi:hypothetical protein